MFLILDLYICILIWFLVFRLFYTFTTGFNFKSYESDWPGPSQILSSLCAWHPLHIQLFISNILLSLLCPLFQDNSSCVLTTSSSWPVLCHTFQYLYSFVYGCSHMDQKTGYLSAGWWTLWVFLLTPSPPPIHAPGTVHNSLDRLPGWAISASVPLSRKSSITALPCFLLFRAEAFLFIDLVQPLLQSRIPGTS